MSIVPVAVAASSMAGIEMPAVASGGFTRGVAGARRVVLGATEAGLVIRGGRREIAIPFEDIALVRAGWHLTIFPPFVDWQPALWVARRNERHLLRFIADDGKGYETMVRALATVLLARARGPRFELGGNHAVAIGAASVCAVLAVVFAAAAVLTAIDNAWPGTVTLIGLTSFFGWRASRFAKDRPRVAAGIDDVEPFLKPFGPDGIARTF